jgi:hypothetical protein
MTLAGRSGTIDIDDLGTVYRLEPRPPAAEAASWLNVSPHKATAIAR